VNNRDAYSYHRKSKLGQLIFLVPIGIVIFLQGIIDIIYLLPIALTLLALFPLIKSTIKISYIAGLLGSLAFIAKERLNSPQFGEILMISAVLSFVLFGVLAEIRYRRKSPDD